VLVLRVRWHGSAGVPQSPAVTLLLYYCVLLIHGSRSGSVSLGLQNDAIDRPCRRPLAYNVCCCRVAVRKHNRLLQLTSHDLKALSGW